jgi:hypothetical protein
MAIASKSRIVLRGRRRRRRFCAVATSAGFGVGIGREFLFASATHSAYFCSLDDAEGDRHIRVVDAADLRALAVIRAGSLVGLEPGFVQAARHGVDLHAEGRHREWSG